MISYPGITDFMVKLLLATPTLHLLLYYHPLHFMETRNPRCIKRWVLQVLHALDDPVTALLARSACSCCSCTTVNKVQSQDPAFHENWNILEYFQVWLCSALWSNAKPFAGFFFWSSATLRWWTFSFQAWWTPCHMQRMHIWFISLKCSPIPMWGFLHMGDSQWVNPGLTLG